MKLFTLQADLALNTTGFDTGVRRASEKISSLRGNLNGMASEAEDTKRRFDIALGTAIGDFIGKLAGAMTEAVFEWTSDGILLASSMEETNSKINTIFGDGADAIHKWAQTTRESFGIGELTAKNYAAQVAGILSTDSKNLTPKEIQEVSTSLVELAGDLASFHNMTFDDVFGKLMSGLRGETEAIEALGVDLRASAVAASFGMTAKEWGGLDQRTRLLNTYQYIMKETAVAQGDFARTSDSYANQLRILDENINSLKLALGESILPVVTELVAWFNSLFGSQEKAAKSSEDFVTGMATSYADIALTTGKALSLVEALDELSESTEDASSSEMWQSLLAELEATIPGIGELIDGNTGKIKGGTEALKAYVEQWRISAQEMARTNAIKSYYDEYAAMERDLWDMQIEQQINKNMIDGMTQSVDSYLSAMMETLIPAIGSDYATPDTLAYLRSTDGLQELYDAISSGDTNAILSGTGLSLSSMLDAAGAWQQFEDLQNLVSQYESQLESLPTYEEEIAAQQQQIAAYEERLAALEQIVNRDSLLRKNQQGEQGAEGAETGTLAEATAALQTVTESLSTLKADVIAATKEGSMAGCQAGVGSISVTGSVSTGNVTLNTGALVGSLAPKLNLRLGVRNEIR